jgi:S-methylmethionine-dependent homocysteine/selenocysteine methylase
MEAPPPIDSLSLRVLAGAPALDRRAFPRPGSVARWFEPFHVRQPLVARGEIMAQVTAGADIIVAPAWLTHRRALEGVGESRRARAWTDAAVRLARDAVEAGIERQATEGLQTRQVLVAGPLPDVEAGPEHATGRLLPASASRERDTHDQAGILADTGVDLIVVEPRATFEASLEATRAAAASGRPVWVTIPLDDDAGAPRLAERAAAMVASGAACILLNLTGTADPTAVAERTASVAGAHVPIGLCVDGSSLAASPDDIDAWVAVGARVLGLLSGADPTAIRPLVEARGRLLEDARVRRDAAQGSLTAWVGDAASRAPGGRALWLGPLDMPVPSGFEWTVLEDADAARTVALPRAAFRLVVALAAVEMGLLARLLDHGGIVAVEGPSDDEGRHALAADGIRIQEVVSMPDGRIRLIGRREDG